MNQPNEPAPPRDDLEQYAGEVIPDPWDDPEQTDWPMNPSPPSPPQDGA